MGCKRVALVLAGGFDQIALIDELSSRGYYTVLVDYLESPVAADHADLHIRQSTLDVEAVETAARTFGARLVVTACTDQALLTAATVSERLGLPFYLNSTTARMVTDKTVMKRLMVDAGIPTSRFVALGDCWEDDLNCLEYPLVVKPCDCNSSKGVVKVCSPSDIEGAVLAARGLSRTRGVIVEEFVEGRELSLDFWIGPNGPKILCASESVKSSAGRSFTIVGSRSVPLTDDLTSRSESVARSISTAFGVDRGPLLVQVIQGDDGSLSVIEFSARMGGGTKYRLIDSVAGVNIMGRFADFLLGDLDVEVTTHPQCGLFEMCYLYTTGGVLRGFKGFDEALSSSLIESYFTYRSPGSQFDSRENSGDRAAGVMFHSHDDASLEELKRRAFQIIDLVDEAGGSMLCREMLS